MERFEITLNTSSLQLSVDVALTQKLRPTAKILHALMVGWSDKDGWVERDQEEMAEYLATSPRVLRYMIEELVAARLVEIYKDGNA